MVDEKNVKQLSGADAASDSASATGVLLLGGGGTAANEVEVEYMSGIYTPGVLMENVIVGNRLKERY